MRLSTSSRAVTAPPPETAATNGTAAAAVGPAGRRSSSPSPSRSRRRRIVAVAAAVAVAAVAVAGTLLSRRDDGATTASASTGTKAVDVVRRDLVVTDQYDGELGYGEAAAITAGGAGVVTGVAPVGSVVEQGKTLFGVDLQPAVLLYGSVPAFRELSVDSEAGADIAQLEKALVALGYGRGVTVDQTFTASTAAAVKRWETALGRFDPDGVVALGDVVFRPGAVRIAAVAAVVGTQVKSDSAVVEATTTAKVVTASVSADQANRLSVGTAVTLGLPDGKDTTGKITGIAAAGASQGQPGGSNMTVTITLDDPSVASGFDSGSVDVTVERSRVDDAIAVPVTALLALAEGGYAVQVVETTVPAGYRLAGVKVGTYADDYVQVTGTGITAGTKVLVPR